MGVPDRVEGVVDGARAALDATKKNLHKKRSGPTSGITLNARELCSAEKKLESRP